MGQYGNASLQERIERRRKQEKAKRLKILAVVLAVILVIAAAVAIWLFTGNSKNEEVSDDTPIITTDALPTPEEEAPKPEETPEAVPETTQEPSDSESEATSNTGEEMPVGIESALKVQGESLVIFVSSRAAAMVADIDMQVKAAGNTGEIDPEKPMIALTFDDGPHPKNTIRILDALEKVNGRATFFVLGELIDGNSAILKRATDLGCEIGNHSYDHSNFTKLSGKQITKQISDTNALIKAATGTEAKLVRIPNGSLNDTIRSSVGAPIIYWRLDTRDWESRNADKIVDKVLKEVEDGDIILMHDIHNASAEAAERLIPELVSKGYQLVTVSELMEARGIKMVNGRQFSVARKKDE